MNQFQLHALPVTQPLPPAWGPVLERMLWRVQKSLSREQRRLFRFIEVGQDVAGLLVRWTWDGPEDQMAKVSLAVHEHIDRTEEEIEELELGPRYMAEMAMDVPAEGRHG